MATLGGYLNSKHGLCLLAFRFVVNPCAEKVLIVTADSRILVGTLSACDQSTNLVRTFLTCGSPVLTTGLGSNRDSRARHPRDRRQRTVSDCPAGAVPRARRQCLLCRPGGRETR